MLLEREGHEILTVEEVKTLTQTAIVKTHHTMYAHVRLTAPEQVAVNEAITLQIRLSKWDNDATVTDYTPTLTVSVDSEPVAEVDPVGGEVTIPLQFTDPGTYTIEVGCQTVSPARVEVLVE